MSADEPPRCDARVEASQEALAAIETAERVG